MVCYYATELEKLLCHLLRDPKFKIPEKVTKFIGNMLESEPGRMKWPARVFVWKLSREFDELGTHTVCRE